MIKTSHSKYFRLVNDVETRLGCSFALGSLASSSFRRMLSFVYMLTQRRRNETKQAKDAEEEMQKYLRQRQEIINQAKRQERELILSEERARIEQQASEASSGGDGFGRGGRSSSSAAAAVVANCGAGLTVTSDMGRRTQSSTGASFFGRHARQSSYAAPGREARAGREEGGSSRPGPSRSNAQPFEQIRQKCVEDNITNLFGL